MIARQDGDKQLLNARSASGSWRRKAMSTRPCFKSSANVTENPLDTLIKILGNSSLRMRAARVSQAASCPVRNPMAKVGLAGRAARRLHSGFGLRQRKAGVIKEGALGGREFDAAHAAGEHRPRQLHARDRASGD
jgi:hypothetical protein